MIDFFKVVLVKFEVVVVWECMVWILGDFQVWISFKKLVCNVVCDLSEVGIVVVMVSVDIVCCNLGVVVGVMVVVGLFFVCYCIIVLFCCGYYQIDVV